MPSIAVKLHKQVTDIAPGAAFRYEDTDFESPTLIAERLQEVAEDVLPSVVFIGRDNVGEIAESVTSVAGEVAQDAEYEVHVVRHFSPTTVRALPSGVERYPIQ